MLSKLLVLLLANTINPTCVISERLVRSDAMKGFANHLRNFEWTVLYELK